MNHYAVEFEIDNFPPDGLVGMAFPALAHFNRTPLVTTLAAEGQTAPVFAFRIADTDAELFIGGVNPANFKGAFRYVSLVEEVGVVICPAHGRFINACLKIRTGGEWNCKVWR